jgi:hypothetical protein
MRRTTLFAILFIFFIFRTGLAQTPAELTRILGQTDVTAVRMLGASLDQKHSANHELALKLAGEKGWVIRSVAPDGKVMELQGVNEHGIPLYYTTDNLNAAKTVSTNKVWSGGGLGLSLSGTGMILREWDEGKVRNTHQELTGRVTQVDGAATLSPHSTHVAGTMIATGVDANAHGMANQATLRAFDWNSDFAEMASEGALGAMLSNSSYGYVTGWYNGSGSWVWYGDPSISNLEDYNFGFYSTNCRDIDDLTFMAPYFLPCKSAGNDRGDYNGSGPQEPDGGADGFDCISDWGLAKNVLTVGAVNDIPGGYTNPSQVVMSSFSGWGPTDDGRIKPDIVANGIGLWSSVSTGDNSYASYSGTSMATPNTCGSLMLLQQHHNNLYGAFMKAATLKALVIHTADESGANAGPDYSFGWGLLNTATAAQVISQKNVSSLINEATLGNGATYTIDVTSAGSVPLRATLCWTDRKGTPLAPALNPPDPMLVNDLDLRIDGAYQPWVLNPASPSSAASTGDNTRDNVEQVYIASASAGTHTITVTHKGTLTGGFQNFSLIVTGITIAVADPYPFAAQAFSGNQVDLAWTRNSSSNNVLVAWSPTGTIGTPANGSSYAAGNTIPGGGTVLYNGPATTFSHSGLTPLTNYFYKAWSVTAGSAYSPGITSQATTSCPVYDLFPITEDFETSSTDLPVCWSQQSTSGTSDWSVSATNLAGGTGNEMMATWSTANPGTTRVKTYFFNTTGATSLNLSFNHMFDDYAAGCTAKVQTSTDGVNWTDEGWSLASGGGNVSGPVTTTLTHNLDSPTTTVAFVVTGNLYNYDFWHIDDVRITAPGFWIGGTAGNPTNWNTATNWGDGLVPTAATNVVVPPRVHLPVITNDPASPAVCNNLLIMQDATVTVQPGKKLEVNGILTLKGAIVK